MTDEQITIEVAKLDGVNQLGDNFIEHKPYLTSRDAIIPVIEKHWRKVGSESWAEWQMRFYDGIIPHNLNSILFATPRQLCIALLKATGHYL